MIKATRIFSRFPMISVVMPIYNAEPYIGATLDSVLSQSFKDMEVICVNDGSTDASLEILQEYAKRDARVSIISQENQGVGNARNNGMRQARGECLSFLDADDILLPNMYAKMLQKMTQTSADIVICRTEGFDTNSGAVIPMPYSFQEKYLDNPEAEWFTYKNFADRIFNLCVGWTWDKLYRHSFIKKNKLSFQELRRADDAYFSFISLTKAERIAFEPSILIKHRMNVKTSLSSTRGEFYDCFFYAMKKLESELIHMGIYKEVEKGFINWVGRYILWHYTTMQHPYKAKLHTFLKKTVIPYFKLDSYSQNFFHEDKTYYSIQDFVWDKKLRARPLISVIVTGYNVEDYLDLCMTRLINQTYDKLEIIYINDGSTDASSSIVESYAQKDDRISIYNFNRNTPGGVASPANIGLELARGDYIAFCDGDDWMRGDALELCLKKAIDTQADFVVMKALLFYTKTEKYAPHYEEPYWKAGVQHKKDINEIKKIFFLMGSEPWKKFYRADFIKKNGLRFPEGNFFFEDSAFHAMCTAQAESISFLDASLYFYRQHDRSTSRGKSEIKARFFEVYAITKQWLIDSGHYTQYKKVFIHKFLKALPFMFALCPQQTYLIAYNGIKNILADATLEELLDLFEKLSYRQEDIKLVLHALAKDAIEFCIKAYDWKPR